jgi:hypothetical protein
MSDEESIERERGAMDLICLLLDLEGSGMPSPIMASLGYTEMNTCVAL